jgi:hypothetical protein
MSLTCYSSHLAHGGRESGAPLADQRAHQAKAMAVSPAPSPEEVSSALRPRLAGRFRGEVTDVEAPGLVTGGFGFGIYGLHFGGAGLPAQWTAPLIARIPAAAERFVPLERECRLQAWVAAHGYAAPPGFS